MKSIILIILFITVNLTVGAIQNDPEYLNLKNKTNHEIADSAAEACLVFVQHLIEHGQKEDSISYYINKAESLFKDTRNKKGLVNISIYRANRAIRLGNYNSADSLIEDIDINKYPDLKVGFLNAKARIHLSKNELEKSLESFLEASIIMEEMQDSLKLSKLFNNIAVLFGILRQFDKELIYRHKAIQYANGNKNLVVKAQLLNNLATSFGKKELIDSCLKYTNLALRLAKKAKSNVITGQSYNILAGTNIVLDDYDNAILYADSAIQILNEPKDIQIMSSAYQYLTQAYLGKEDLNKALKYAKQALEFNLKFGRVNSVESCYERLYEIYKLKGDYKAALQYMEKMNQIGDSIYKIETSEKINQLELEYQQLNQEKTILEKDKENLLQKERIYYGSIIFLTFLVIATIIVLTLIRKHSLARRKALSFEQKLLRSQLNPHFIFNALGAVQTYIMKSKPMESASYLSKFAKLMRNILENSRVEYISLEEEIETLENYVALQQLRMKDKFVFHLDHSSIQDISDIKVPPMLIQPFVENAIEHGFQDINYIGNLNVVYTIKEEFLNIKVEDNGAGENKAIKDPNHKSRSTQIISERLFQIYGSRAKFQIFPGTEKGYCVQINLPL
ncbi:MAG: histidine kinase [Flavobacteriales bacterium]|nr:histidine kinase [Flavobacteriales bacterium]